MTRLSPPDPVGYTDDQRRVAQAITSGPRGSVRGPLAIWLHRPVLADKAQALGEYCRFQTALGSRLCELAIMLTARFWGSEYEWRGHRPHALAAGISEAVIEAIRLNTKPELLNSEEQAVYDVANALNSNHRIDAALFEHATTVLGAEGMVDLVGVLGYYTLISMTINAFEIHPPGDGIGELNDSRSGHPEADLSGAIHA